MLGFDGDYYPNVETIISLPAGLSGHRRSGSRRGGVIAERMSPIGRGGPARPGDRLLGGRSAAASRRAAGSNVVLHEFAHKLDMRDGAADGAPYLQRCRADRGVVAGDERGVSALVERTQAGEPTLLDPYGATNAAEFFAVATECFFEQALPMQSQHAELYGVLRDYYRQDPAGRGTD